MNYNIYDLEKYNVNIKLDGNSKNRSAEILNTRLKTMGYKLVFKKIPIEKIYEIFPKALIGSITMVIGITLMGFIGTYIQINGQENIWGIIIALFTAFTIALISHYSKGIVRILPFLML